MKWVKQKKWENVVNKMDWQMEWQKDFEFCEYLVELHLEIKQNNPHKTDEQIAEELRPYVRDSWEMWKTLGKMKNQKGV